MKSLDDISAGQNKWLLLLEAVFPEIYAQETITHKQLKQVDADFRKMRALDKRYKVSWPIWLIMNNQVSRGVYLIPKDTEDLNKPEADQELVDELESELEGFGIEA